MQKFSFEIVKNIAKKLEKYKDEQSLAKIYKWPLPVLPNALNSVFSDIDSLNTYEKTIKLREWFGEFLRNINEEDRKYLYQWIVKNWGGIKTGKDDNLTKAAIQAITSHCQNFDKFQFSGISSWSKILAFQYPKTRAIYDVRVIYTLNWLLLQTGYSGRFFPSPSGRNSLINFFSYEKTLYKKVLGLSKIREAFKEEFERKLGSDKSIKSAMINSLGKEVYIDQIYAYQAYCNLLIDTANQLFGEKDDFGVTKVEMILFSIADGDIVAEVLGSY
jgi:hypothetical protein